VETLVYSFPVVVFFATPDAARAVAGMQESTKASTNAKLRKRLLFFIATLPFLLVFLYQKRQKPAPTDTDRRCGPNALQ
jgi:hypothetical protein